MPHLFVFLVSRISEPLRRIARLLILMREKDVIEKKERLREFLVPRQFDFVMECIRDLAGYDEDPATVAHKAIRSPNLALKLGHDLRKLSTLMLMFAAQDRDKVLRRDAKDFDRFVEKFFSDHVSSRAVKVRKISLHMGLFRRQSV